MTAGSSTIGGSRLDRLSQVEKVATLNSLEECDGFELGYKWTARALEPDVKAALVVRRITIRREAARHAR